MFTERTHAKNGGGFKVLSALMTHAENGGGLFPELNIKSIPRHGKC